MPWITMSTGCGGSLFSVRYFPNGSPFCLPEIRTSDNERDMDKIKICEAMYALPGEVVVRRRKSLVLPAALLAAGVAILVLNHVYGASMTNNLRSSAVFIGGSLALAGMITLAARFSAPRARPTTVPDAVTCATTNSTSSAPRAAMWWPSWRKAMWNGCWQCPMRGFRRSPWPCTVRPTTASPPCRPSSTLTWNTGR